MSDMKNVSSKNKTQRLADLKKRLADYAVTYRNDLRNFGVLWIISFGAALAINSPTAINYSEGGFGHFLGSLLVVQLILFVFYKDIKRYKPAFYSDPKMMILLALLVVGTLVVSRFFSYFLAVVQRGSDLSGDSFMYGIPLAAGAMLITLIFDFHLAISFSFVMSLLSGIWQHSPHFSIYTFVGSLTAAFSVLRCRRRSTLIRAGLYVCAANILTVGIILLLKGEFLSEQAMVSFLFAVFGGVCVIAIVMSVLPMIEYAFQLRTDISLVELLDHDQELLRMLMLNAPGTYHHSVIVGSLAEAAAEAIGVNPLMARVTAYYHDIGKAKMPEYFIENQAGAVSKHEKLTPHMSSIILISHVKEGIELARQYKLPKPVLDVIQQHHGTSLMTYFYQKALEQAGTTPPHHEEFRKPGPKPQPRIAA
jgi:putative nucleotidyltransferase with HDIG domain